MKLLCKVQWNNVLEWSGTGRRWSYDAIFNEIMFLNGPAQGDDEVIMQGSMK